MELRSKTLNLFRIIIHDVRNILVEFLRFFQRVEKF